MVQKRDALPEATSLRKDINKLFEHLAQIDSAEPGLDLGEWFPRVDVLETKKSVVVNVEAPGFGIDELEVVFKGPKLVLSGEKRKPPVDETVRGYLCLERSFGKFSRSLYIDQATDLTQARAELSDGVLTVTIPKLEDRRGSEFRLKIEMAGS